MVRGEYRLLNLEQNFWVGACLNIRWDSQWQPEWFQVTIVRDPVSRLVSEYQYVLNEIHSHRRIQFLDPSHRKAILNSETQMSIVDYAMLGTDVN